MKLELRNTKGGKMKKVLTSLEFGKYLKDLSPKEFCEVFGYVDYDWSSRDDRYKIDSLKLYNRNRYDELVSRELELRMFVPCVDGKPIEEPEDYKLWLKKHNTKEKIEGLKKDFADEFKVYLGYNQAKGRVLFEGWKITDQIQVGAREKEGNKTWMRYTLSGQGNQDIRFERGLVGYAHRDSHIWRSAKTIEDLARNVELIPTKNFLNQIGI